MERSDQKISILLDGGIADRRAIELRGSVVQQLASPALARADNVRLSITRGVPERAPGMQTIVTGLPDECHGIIPAGRVGNALALFRGVDSKKINDMSISVPFTPISIITGGPVTPLHVLASGKSGHKPSSCHPTSCEDPETGYIWTAFLDTTTVGTPIVTVVKQDGTLIVGPSSIGTVSSAYSDWIYITPTSGGYAYIWLYYPGIGLHKIQVLHDSANGTVYALTNEVLVYMPANDSIPDMIRYDQTRVLIYGGDDSVAANARLMMYTPDSGALSRSLPVSVGSTAVYAVMVVQRYGVPRIATAAATSTGPALYVGLYDSSLSALWNVTRATTTTQGAVAVGFCAYRDAASAWVAVVSSDVSGSFSSPTDGSASITTTARLIRVSDGSSFLPSGFTRGWRRLIGKCGQLKPSDSELSPIFMLVPMFSSSAADASSVDYVDDPAIELWQVSSLYPVDDSTFLGVVGRIGVIRGSIAPALVSVSQLPDCPGQISSLSDGTSLYIQYLNSIKSTGIVYAGKSAYLSNFAQLSSAPRQLLISGDSYGSSIVASALPMSWDGFELTEFGGPLTRPHLNHDSAAGSGDVYPAGSYSFVAYHRWVDAAGSVVRSRISNVVTIAASGVDAPYTFVASFPSGTRKYGAEGIIETVLAATPKNQPDFHEIATANIVSSDATTHTFTNVKIPLSSDPILYSDGALGSELMPQAPPPLFDVSIVSGRAWGIDAEYRFRAVYSKLRVTGGSYEFVPELEMVFPRVGGRLMRVFEVSGVPVVLAERAVWLVSGSGPDNTGANGSFAAPMKLSDFGCTDPYSAQSFPGGIVWSGKGRWYILSGSTVMQVSDVNAEMNFLCSVGMRDQDEIVFYGTELSSDPTVGETTDAVFMTDLDGSFMTDLDGSFIVESESTTVVTTSGGDPVAKVYNYILNRWTRWVSPVARAFTQAANSPNEFRRHIGFQQNALVVVDGESYAANAPMVLETDWMILGGDFQDHVIVRDIIFNAERHSDHDVTIEAFTNYKLTATTSRSYSPSVIASVVAEQGSDPRYSLRVEPAEQETRAVKIRLTITVTGSDVGCRPISLTILFAVFAPVREESFSKALGGFQ